MKVYTLLMDRNITDPLENTHDSLFDSFFLQRVRDVFPFLLACFSFLLMFNPKRNGRNFQQLLACQAH